MHQGGQGKAGQGGQGGEGGLGGRGGQGSAAGRLCGGRVHWREPGGRNGLVVLVVVIQS